MQPGIKNKNSDIKTFLKTKFYYVYSMDQEGDACKV